MISNDTLGYKRCCFQSYFSIILRRRLQDCRNLIFKNIQEWADNYLRKQNYFFNLINFFLGTKMSSNKKIYGAWQKGGFKDKDEKSSLSFTKS